ncbi:MAG: glutathione S-transferase [Pseudomonadota bacterium]
MLVVHHLENSRSQRVLWLLEELGVEYEIRSWKRDPTTKLAPPELRDVHPLGKAPMLDIDGEIVAESGLIFEVLLERFDQGRLLPTTGSAEHKQYRYWMHFAEGTFMPFMIIALIMSRIETTKMPFFAKPIAKRIVAAVRSGFLDDNIRRNLEFMESTLAASPWFCGEEMTAADIMMSLPVEAAAARVGLEERYPALASFAERIHALPAYQRAVERGGPYELMRG